MQVVYEVQYRSLVEPQDGICFPCDEQGHVDLDGLSPQAVENYLFVRAMVGRAFEPPALRQRCANKPAHPAAGVAE